MEQKTHVDDMGIEDFLAIEFNRSLYHDLNNILKNHITESNLSFFRTMYRDVVYFYSKFEVIPYEVNEFFNERFYESSVNFEYYIKANIFDVIISNVTRNFTFSSKENKYLSEHENPFIYDSGIFDYWGFSNFYFQVLLERMEKNIKHRSENKFVFDYNYHLVLKKFIESIDISDRSTKKLNEQKTEKIEIQETAEYIGTRSQIALFYAVMQNSGLKPRFKEKIKDIREICPQLIIEETGDPITEKSFQLKYNEITSKKIGYSGNDYMKVEKVITEKYPEALPALKTFFRRDLF